MANMYDKPVNLDFINTYVSPDFNMLMKSGAAMQGRADQAQAMEEQMQDKLLNVKYLSEDKLETDKLTAEYEDAISKKFEEVGGSYSKMAPFIKEQRKKLHRDVTRGTLGQVQQNYDSYGKWYTDTKERVLSGDVSKREFNIANAKIRDEYKGVGTPEDLQSIQTMDLVDQYNYGELALEIAGNIKGSSYTTIGDWIQGEGIAEGDIPPYMYSQKTTNIEQLRPEEIDAVVKAAIKTNPVYADHLKQRGDLLMWDHERKLENAGSDLVKERGGINEDDAEIMKTIDTLDEKGDKRKLDPNNPEDVETYARMLKRQEFQYDLVDNAAAVAAETFDYQKVKQSSKTMTDQKAAKKIIDDLELQGNAFSSGTKAQLKGFDLESINTDINTNKESIQNTIQTLDDGFSKFGLKTELMSYWQKGKDVDIAADFISKMNTTDGQKTMIEKIMKKGNLDYNSALQEAAKLKQEALAVVGLNSKVELQEGIINNATEIVNKNNKIANNNTYNEYIKLYDNVRYRESGISAPGSEVPMSREEYEERSKNMRTKEEWAEEFKKEIIIGKYGPGATSEKMAENKNITGYGELDGSNPMHKLYTMWNRDNKEIRKIASDGYSQYYTKLDLTASKGTPSSVSNEISSAAEAIADPSTRIVVNGIDTNILNAFGVTRMDDLKNVDGDVIFDKGKPFYLITADVKDGTSQTILAEIPGRASSVHNTMKSLVGSSDNTVSLGAKTYLGAELMGDFWKPERIGLLNEGKSLPIRLAQGEPLGKVIKEDGYLKLMIDFQDGNGLISYGPLHSSPDEISRTIYELYETFQKTQ
tara:strand:+ start:156 stop:2597 length:2442 start_codon:yes stop_codon:yes gene_type:complete